MNILSIDFNKDFIRKCLHCQKEMSVTMRRHAKFCSHYCNKMSKKRPYNNLEKIKCEKCEFIPIHKCQLDIDHIDGNHKNNKRSNLQILCANCHRLKTHFQKENVNKKPLNF